jgi:putative oxidoreductase
MDYKKILFCSHSNTTLVNLGMLFLRIVFGFTMITHGWPKFANFTMLSATFLDPIGIGSTLSLALVVFAELFASILLIIGLGTRVALIPMIINMLVAYFIVHANDPFANKELAFLYLAVYVALMIIGPGKFSLDAKFQSSKSEYLKV